jgi:hypothetical protein
MSAIVVILGLTALTVGTIRLGLMAVRHAQYLLGVRHLPKVSEWQARQNAKPLSSAIIHVVGEPPDRGDG